MFSAETSNPVVPAGTWTHFSCTYTATGGKSEIYVNGMLKKQEFTGSGILSQVNILYNRESHLKMTKTFLKKTQMRNEEMATTNTEKLEVN